MLSSDLYTVFLLVCFALQRAMCSHWIFNRDAWVELVRLKSFFEKIYLVLSVWSYGKEDESVPKCPLPYIPECKRTPIHKEMLGDLLSHKK